MITTNLVISINILFLSINYKVKMIIKFKECSKFQGSFYSVKSDSSKWQFELKGKKTC